MTLESREANGEAAAGVGNEAMQAVPLRLGFRVTARWIYLVGSV